jgi:hypothetical protein
VIDDLTPTAERLISAEVRAAVAETTVLHQGDKIAELEVLAAPARRLGPTFGRSIDALEGKVALQREENEVLGSPATTLGDKIYFWTHRREAMSDHPEKPSGGAAAPKKASGGGGHGGGGGGFGGGLSALLVGIVIVAVVVVMLVNAWPALFGRPASSTTTTTIVAPTTPEVVAPVRTDAAPVDSADASTDDLLSEKTCSESEMIYVEGIGCVFPAE